MVLLSSSSSQQPQRKLVHSPKSASGVASEFWSRLLTIGTCEHRKGAGVV